MPYGQQYGRGEGYFYWELAHLDAADPLRKITTRETIYTYTQRFPIKIQREGTKLPNIHILSLSCQAGSPTAGSSKGRNTHPKSRNTKKNTASTRTFSKSSREVFPASCAVRDYYLIISKGPCPAIFFTANNSNRSASKCWLSPFALHGYPGITVNIPQPTQSCKVITVNISQMINPNT